MHNDLQKFYSTYGQNKGNRVEIRHDLNRTYAGGRWLNWRKLKGRAIVEYVNGEIWEVELHWFESSGVGRKDEKDKQRFRRIA